jgi:hypothetical protein
MANADMLRTLYIALVMGPLALFRDEALIRAHNHEWPDHVLYRVSLTSLYLISKSHILLLIGNSFPCIFRRQGAFTL